MEASTGAPPPLDRQDVADAFRTIAEMLEALGENPFKARAYVNGARALETMEGDLGEMIASGELAAQKGFGKALVEKATELWRTGGLRYLDELRARLPPGLSEIETIPGLGPRKAMALCRDLGVASLDELEDACRQGRVRELTGFGARSEATILEGIEFARRNRSRRLIPQAESIAADLIAALRGLPGVETADVAGSLRRRRETIGDVDLLATSDNPGAVVAAFTRLPGVTSVVSSGEDRCSVRLDAGVQADLIVVSPAQRGAALLHFTGSKEFNQALRARARSRGMKLNEFGLFGDDGSGAAERLIRSDDEAAILGELGLPYLPPEIREEPSDVDDAPAKTARLVELADLRGILHVHSTWSDGRDTLADMIAGAQERGHEYVGISDHSRTAAYANGMSIERVAAQAEELDALRSRFTIRILRGVESDILADGSLDYPDEVLDAFDFVIASVHSQFRMTEAEMTRRLVRAASDPRTRVIGHLTGRLLLKREGFGFDLDAVLRACRENDVAIEINAWPNRLDMDWRQARRLPDAGVLACINPDAHRVSELDFLRHGVDIARKARLGPEHVLNTRDASALTRDRA